MDIQHLLTTLQTLSSASELTLSNLVLALVMALLCGGIISGTYSHLSRSSGNHNQADGQTKKGNGQGQRFQRSFAITLIFLPAVVSMIILLIGANLARAFSLAGAFSIIRFRSEPGDPRDIALVLFAMAAGLAAGVGMPHFGLLITLVLSGVLLLVDWFFQWSSKADNTGYALTITVPEDMDFNGILPEILRAYCCQVDLESVKLTGLGSLYQLKYRVTLKAEAQSKPLLDAIRTVNGNLAIQFINLSQM